MDAGRGAAQSRQQTGKRACARDSEQRAGGQSCGVQCAAQARGLKARARVQLDAAGGAGRMAQDGTGWDAQSSSQPRSVCASAEGARPPLHSIDRDLSALGPFQNPLAT